MPPWKREAPRQLVFKVGDQVHYGYNGDRYPGTVVAIERGGRTVVVRPDEFTIDPSDRGLKEGNRVGTFSPGSDDPFNRIKFLYREGRGFIRQGSSSGYWLQHGHAWAQNPSF